MQRLIQYKWKATGYYTRDMIQVKLKGKGLVIIDNYDQLNVGQIMEKLKQYIFDTYKSKKGYMREVEDITSLEYEEVPII